MKQDIFTIERNEIIALNTYRMLLRGDCSDILRPGQFVNIKLDGFFLRRPISVCDLTGDELTLIYKIAGEGTESLSMMKEGQALDILTGLGNGYDVSKSGRRPALCGGGAGAPPLLWLCRKLIEAGKEPMVFMGFNQEAEIILEDEFRGLGIEPVIATMDGSRGVKGPVTQAIKGRDYDYVFACGPELMLRAVCELDAHDGQISLEERMGCGFGVCVGCTHKTKFGHKRICKDGPVLDKGEIVW